MVCRLCLKYLEDLINIFDASGQKLNMAKVVGKYFWFKPLKNDPISTAICKHCWLKVFDFHEFYEMVERAQCQITDGFVVKIENNSTLSNKSEPSDDEFDKLHEVPFNMTLDDATDEVENMITGGLNTKAPRDVLSSQDFSQDEDEDEDNDQDDLYRDSEKDDNDSPDDNTIEKTLKAHNSEDSIKNEKPISSIIKKVNRKSTRNSNKSKLNRKIPSDNDSEDNTIIKRKRGRPKTREDKLRKPAKSKEEQEAYKAKMKEYDNQIAQYMALYCEVCNSEAGNFPALRVHMRDAHNIMDGYVTCCDKKFNKRALLVYHIRHHLNPNCYRCEECDFTFSDRQSMHNHFLVKHQKEEDKLYECSNCPKKFSRKYLLEQHNAFSHRGRISKCKNCNKRFKTPEELVEHNKEDCSSGTMCDICAKVIQGRAAFKRHQLEHQGVTMPKEQCDLCGLWYKDKRGLKRHRRKHMEAKEPHTCDICQKVSPSRSAMLSHKRYAHGTERLYECSVCQKTFKKPLSLREHMTTHTGEILYSCPHCPKTFNSNANMHSHRKKVHPIEFEETRRLRKLNTFVNDQLVPPISAINNVKEEETKAGQNEECFNNY